MHEVDERFPVVIFTGGPTIDKQVLNFALRLEELPNIRLLAIVSHSPIRGFRGIIKDLWRRRGVLAPAILLRNSLTVVSSALRSPSAVLRRRNFLKQFQDRLHYVEDIHSPDTLRRVREFEPLLGLVYGGPILRPELFSIPRLGTLGIHHGKAPEYRGKKTTFWAMFNGDSEVGVVIQKISSHLDAGEIVKKANLAVGRQSLSRLRKRLDAIGLDLYVDAVLAVLNGDAVFEAQPASRTRLYRDPKPTDIVIFWGKYLARLVRGFDDAG